jgi:hypothetical protein
MRAKTGLAVVAIAAICGGGWWTSTVLASDHDESPLVKQDASMDISDLYIFESGANKTTIIVCWAGFNDSRPQPDDDGVYNPNALYTINIDNDMDNVADIQIYWRYGLNAQEQYGIRWENVPGTDGSNVDGPVETVFPVGTFARAWTGHVEDPFFFDAQGYLETLDQGSPQFMNNRDFLAGLNVTAVAIEIDTDVIIGDGVIQVWTTSARKG